MIFCFTVIINVGFYRISLNFKNQASPFGLINTRTSQIVQYPYVESYPSIVLDRPQTLSFALLVLK